MNFNSINDLKFGNPSVLQKNVLETSNYLDVIFDDFSKTSVPPNSSDATKSELNELSTRVCDIVLTENSEHLKRYHAIHQNTIQFLINNAKSPSINIIELINNIEKDISPLVLRLKYHFQRPRPHQLSYYYKLKLFPLFLNRIDTPSYPSKTALLSNVVCKVLANYHPESFEAYSKLNNYISSSPTFIGTNYMSDITASTILSNEILKNKEFAKKYNI